LSEPLPAMGQAEQDQLTRQVGRALLGAAPPGWTRIRAEYRSAGRHIEVDVFVTGPDGTEHPMRPPMEVVDGLGRMRQGMYRPGRGTWLSAIYTLEPPSSFTVDFEPDLEPRWRRIPPPVGFQDELRFFPRSEDAIPDWFRERAGLPPAGAAMPPPAATPPAGLPQTVHPGQPPVPAGPPPNWAAVPPGQPLPPPGRPEFAGPPPGWSPPPPPDAT
jgi:hypothetical protein